jgi:hypothetical protein
VVSTVTSSHSGGGPRMPHSEVRLQELRCGQGNITLDVSSVGHLGSCKKKKMTKVSCLYKKSHSCPLGWADGDFYTDSFILDDSYVPKSTSCTDLDFQSWAKGLAGGAWFSAPFLFTFPTWWPCPRGFPAPQSQLRSSLDINWLILQVLHKLEHITKENH